MKALFSKSLFSYAIGILFIVAITGGILSPIVDNFFVLISVLVIEYIIFIIILLHFFDKYIKPIKKASRTVDQLVQGNYRARVRHPATGSIGALSTKINALARNLSDLSMHEQLQAEHLSTVIDNTESGLALIDEKGYIHLVIVSLLQCLEKHRKIILDIFITMCWTMKKFIRRCRKHFYTKKMSRSPLPSRKKQKRIISK